MRGLETPIRRIRRQVFTKVAKLAFESTPETLIDDIEADFLIFFSYHSPFILFSINFVSAAPDDL